MKKLKFSHYLLSLMPMESQVSFLFFFILKQLPIYFSFLDELIL